jgi:hypothetical protein
MRAFTRNSAAFVSNLPLGRAATASSFFWMDTAARERSLAAVVFAA